jgi:hypothetical protein
MLLPPPPNSVVSTPAALPTISAPPYWWVERILLPSLFLFLGAFIGFVGTWVRDGIEARRAKKAFMRAIRRELIGLQSQVAGSIADVSTALDKLFSSHHIPVFAISFGTTVFPSQLSKLRDVYDPLVLEIIELYSALPRLEQIGALLNQTSTEGRALKRLPSATEPNSEKDDKFLTALSSVASACRVLHEQLQPIHLRFGKLISLPG